MHYASEWATDTESFFAMRQGHTAGDAGKHSRWLPGNEEMLQADWLKGKSSLPCEEAESNIQ